VGKNPPNPTRPTKLSDPFVHPSVREHIYGRIRIQIFFIFGFQTDNRFKVFDWVSTRPLHIPIDISPHPVTHPPTHPYFLTFHFSLSTSFLFSHFIFFFTFHSLSLSLTTSLSHLHSHSLSSQYSVLPLSLSRSRSH
jgi:hypothetical protein